MRSDVLSLVTIVEGYIPLLKLFTCGMQAAHHMQTDIYYNLAYKQFKTYSLERKGTHIVTTDNKEG